jgi:hypothetical protein
MDLEPYPSVHDLNKGTATVESGNDKRTRLNWQQISKEFSTMFLQEHFSSLQC